MVEEMAVCSGGSGRRSSWHWRVKEKMVSKEVGLDNSLGELCLTTC